jgi:hypothetical protein
MSNMWTAPGDDPRSYGNPVGEKATYREYLGNYRLTIEMKCEGLDAAGHADLLRECIDGRTGQ